MRYTFEEEFRLDHPETVGETDRHFDLDNYKDWLEAQLIEARKQLALCNVSGAVEHNFILNNKQRPDKKGVYEVIRSDGSHDFNYFDGSHWLIDVEAGKRPVREWR